MGDKKFFSFFQGTILSSKLPIPSQGFLSFRKCREKALLVFYGGIWRMLTCNSAYVPAALHRLLFHVSMEPANHTRHSQKGSGCYFTTSKSLIFNGSGPLPSNNANNLAPFKSLLLKQLSSSCFRRQTLSIAFSCKERNAGKKKSDSSFYF